MQRINCRPGVQWSPLATVSMDTELWIDGELLKGWTFEEQFIDHKVSLFSSFGSITLFIDSTRNYCGGQNAV